jgi:alanyl-tRNA synthetase
MLKSVISGISKLHPDTPLLLLSEEDGKGVCLTQMPKASVAAGFKANEWLQATLAPSGGRGGGKPDSAQGQVPDAGKMAECIAAAKEFAADKA